MPSRHWTGMVIVSFLLFYLLLNVLLMGRLPFDEAFLVLLSMTVVACIIVKRIIRRAEVAKVAETGLEMEKGAVIPFNAIERIVRDGGGFPSVVFAADSQEIVHFPDREFVRLARTRLNRWTLVPDSWTVEPENITVTPSEPEQELTVEYGVGGKYRTFRLSTSVTRLSYLAFFLLVVSAPPRIYYLVLAIPYLIFEIILPAYKKVHVSVAGDRIMLVDENKVEHILKFGDIAAVEKGFFQIKVSAKNVEVIYFPQRCLLLPALIQDQSGCKADLRRSFLGRCAFEQRRRLFHTDGFIYS